MTYPERTFFKLNMNWILILSLSFGQDSQDSLDNYSPKAIGISRLSSGKPGKKYPENPVNPVKKNKNKIESIP
jgi:hypothetical protein